MFKTIFALLLLFSFASIANAQSNLAAFFDSIAKGDKETVARFLDEGVSANAKNKDGHTALVHAAVNNQIEIIRLLLDKGGDVNGLSVNNETPLVGAVVGGNLEIVKLLHQSGGDINAKDSDGISILFHAVSFSIEEGKDRIAILQYLSGNGADVNTKQKHNYTALMRAASLGQPEVVKLLLSKGAKVNEHANNGTTALFEAIDDGFDSETQKTKLHTMEIVCALIEAGANVNDTGAENLTPLSKAFDYAVDSEYRKIVKLLLEKSSGVNASSLAKAAAIKNVELVKMILSLGVAVNEKSEDGTTALIEAVRDGTDENRNLKAGTIETVRVLLDKGADIKAKDKDGNTPLKLARQQRNFELLWTLLESKYKSSLLTRVSYYCFRYNRIQAFVGPAIYLLAVILSFFAMRKPKQPKRENPPEDGSDGLPRLMPIKCEQCGASVPLTELKDECPRCHLKVEIPKDYKEIIAIRAKAAAQLEAAEKTWRRVTAYSNPILIGFLVLLGIAWFIPSVIGLFSDYSYWRPLPFFVSTILCAITFPVAFVSMAGFLFTSPDDFPPLPKIGEGVGQAETISCQTCGADETLKPNQLVLSCGYCGTENFRASIAGRAKKIASEEEGSTAMSLYDSVVALQERQQLAYQTIATVGTTLLIITIASAALIALVIIAVIIILLYLYITFS